MPRSHRRRPDPGREDSFERLLNGWKRTESRRGIEWNVQPVSAGRAVKSYSCPGCRTMIEPGTAHLVTWRADGIMGDAADLQARRHWHEHCWRIG